MPYLLLIPVFGVLLIEGIFAYKFLANRKRANLLSETPLAKVAELSEQRAKVQGRIVVFDEPLYAPLSRSPCVYFRFKVEEKRRHGGVPPHGGGGSRWRTVINDVQHILCGVDDGTGIAGLDLRKAELELRVGAQTNSGMFNDAPPQLERLLRETYNRSSKGLIFNKSMRYTETRLEQDTTVLVLGSVQATPGGNWQFHKGDDPFIISDQSEGALMTSYKRCAVMWLALAMALPLGLGVVAVLVWLT
jgi:hypothetical protein